MRKAEASSVRRTTARLDEDQRGGRLAARVPALSHMRQALRLGARFTCNGSRVTTRPEMKLLHWFASLRWQVVFALSVVIGVAFASLIAWLPAWLGIVLDVALAFWCGHAVGTFRSESRRLRERIEHCNELTRIHSKTVEQLQELRREVGAPETLN